MSQKKPLILGSASIGRRTVLDSFVPRLSYQVIPADIDEKAIRDPDPVRLTARLAKAKGVAVAERYKEPCVFLTADQVAVYGGEIREKPCNAEEARRWLKSYGRGEPVMLVTSVCVSERMSAGGLSQNVATDTAFVDFYPLPDRAIRDALLRDEIPGSAGAIVIELPVIAVHVKGVWNANGVADAKTSVLGLPKALTTLLLRDYGVL